MKYSEWLEQHGFGSGGFYSEINPAMTQMLDGETEILASVLEKREDLELYSWKKSFMLLTEEKIVTGHIGYRLANDKGPEGLELDFTAIPLRSVASVTINYLRTLQRGFPENKQKCVVKFSDGRPAMTLPPDGVDPYIVNDYLNLGRVLFQLVK